VDDKRKEIVKEFDLILISLFGCPGDSESDSSFKVFKSVTCYLFETIKALEKENLIKLYSSKEDISQD